MSITAKLVEYPNAGYSVHILNGNDLLRIEGDAKTSDETLKAAVAMRKQKLEEAQTRLLRAQAEATQARLMLEAVEVLLVPRGWTSVET
jgi:multidrug resistance efflux pump